MENQVPFVDLAAQLRSIRSEVDDAIAGVLERGDYILGGAVADFESEMAAYCETSFGVGVDSGTSALELALRAFDIGPGDEVITQANTFIASTLAISHTGAEPVLVDVDQDTYAMDVGQLENAITDRTRAIMPVHLYGHPADMDPIMELARNRGLVVIEDASQAHGARYKGRRVGGIGDVGVFSLYPAKNLGALGDAGVIVTGSDDVAERLRLLRNYGSTEKYVHQFKGFNRRLDTIHAAVLSVKLKHLDSWNESRRRLAERYTKLLVEMDGGPVPPGVAEHAEPVYHVYVVRTERRDELRAHLGEAGIGTIIHYPIPVHLQEAYQDMGLARGSFPVTETSAPQILSLPMYPEMEPSSVDRVVSEVENFFGR